MCEVVFFLNFRKIISAQKNEFLLYLSRISFLEKVLIPKIYHQGSDTF